MLSRTKSLLQQLLVLLIGCYCSQWSSVVVLVQSFHTPAPAFSRATGLPNQTFDWRGQKIRYQVGGDVNTATQSIILVHGLFVNADHWRKTINTLSKDGRYVVYALDLLGCGYSSKPDRDSIEAQSLDGENRFNTNGENNDNVSSIARQVTLGTSDGKKTRVADVDLRHPLNSCYNFYTWAEQIADFATNVVLADNNSNSKATLVCNSIGTISSLQATIDAPHLFDGVFVVSPNFRELHVAEVPLPTISMPVIRSVQRLLREKGQSLFDALAKPDTVRQILMEPYAISDAVDEELVDVLLTPLLTPNAANVVFDTLSYSAGPLPEQQLMDASLEDTPIWVCYGDKDPWTPAKRVEALRHIKNGSVVNRVVSLEGVGHCPHDEAPHLVNPLLTEFLESLSDNGKRV